MSDLRLNYSKTSFNSILEILDDLIRIQNNDSFSIRRWGKRILDYGLKQGNFDKVDSNKQRLFKTSERKFKSYKYDLIYYRFIREYDKKDKIKGGPYYSITPLGMLFSQKFQKNFSKNSVIEMFEYFDRMGSNSLKKYTKNSKAQIRFIKKDSWNYFSNDQINKAIKILFKNLLFEQIENRLIITLYVFNPTSLNKTALTQTILSNAFIKKTKPNKTSKEIITTQNDFEFGISIYLNFLIAFYLIIYSKKSELKKIPREFKLNFDSLVDKIQDNAILDFTESEKKRLQTFGYNESKMIKLSTKLRLEEVIRDLE